jgi:hypothetical protein
MRRSRFELHLGQTLQYEHPAHAQHSIVSRFLDTPGATHLLFIDADIGFQPEQVFRLLEFDADFTAAADLSEDFSFCRRWTGMGGEIWVDYLSRLDHVGVMVFHGDLAARVDLPPR